MKYGITFGDDRFSFVFDHSHQASDIQEVVEKAGAEGIELHIALYLKLSDLHSGGIEQAIEEILPVIRKNGCVPVLRGHEDHSDRIEAIGKKLGLEYWSGQRWNQAMKHPWRKQS